MENNLITFTNNELGSVRTILIEDIPYFVGKDVCELFGDTNYRRSLGRLDDDERVCHKVNTLGGKQNMTLVNESGLYSLLFQMQPQKAKGVSQNDKAINKRIEDLKKFKHWVTSEVLPQIRKTGGYIPVNEQDDDLTVMCRAFQILQKTVEQKDELISQLEPKAEVADKFLLAKGCMSMNDAAKTIGIGRNKLMDFLREEKILFRNCGHNIPYQKFCDNGLFIVRQYTDNYGGIHSVTKVTPKGIKYIEKLFANTSV